MTNRVVCCLSFSFLMGILFEKYGSLWPAGGLLALLLYTGQAIIRCQEKPWRVILIRSAACMLAFSCGMCHLRTEQSRRDRLEAAAEESGALTVQGEVLRKEEKQEQLDKLQENMRKEIEETGKEQFGDKFKGVVVSAKNEETAAVSKETGVIGANMNLKV